MRTTVRREKWYHGTGVKPGMNVGAVIEEADLMDCVPDVSLRE